MRVSIVIPAYNAQRYLGETIKSVLIQTLFDWELVVVDDGSTDGTAAIAQTYARRDPRIRLVQQPNAGLANARNRGYAETDPNTPYVIFLDADDVWERDALQTLVQTLEAHPEAVGAHACACCIDSDGHPFLSDTLELSLHYRRAIEAERLVAWPMPKPTTFAVLVVGNPISVGAVLLRRAAMEAVGIFDPACTTCEDWDMWLRLSRHGNFNCVDKVVMNYRIHGGNMSRQSERMYEGIGYVMRKVVSAPDLTEGQRRLAITSIGLRCQDIDDSLALPVMPPAVQLARGILPSLRESLTSLVVTHQLSSEAQRLALASINRIDESLLRARQVDEALRRTDP